MTRIGFFQFSPQERSVEENIKFLVYSLSKEKDCLVVLPELFLQSYSDFKLLPQNKLENVLNELVSFSKNNKLGLVGSLPIKVDRVAKNRSFYINNGIITRVVDKNRLYAEEKKVFSISRNFYPVLKYKNLLFGSCICLDVLDQNTVRKTMLKGIDLFLVSATVSVDLLRTVTKVRSLENQVITIFANRSGKEKTAVQYLGRSSIFLPNGDEVGAGREQVSFRSVQIVTKDLLDMRIKRKKLGIV